MKSLGLIFFEIWGKLHPTRRHHVPEDRNPRLCAHLEPCSITSHNNSVFVLAVAGATWFSLKQVRRDSFLSLRQMMQTVTVP